MTVNDSGHQVAQMEADGAAIPSVAFEALHLVP